MKRHLMLVAAAFLSVPTTMFPQQGIDLTGFWQDNAGGKYEIRQIGNQLFWLDDARPRYVNVFHGTITANTIHGTWADLPGGRTNHTGSLDLRVESNDRLTKTASTVYFGGTVFTRTQASTSERSRVQPATILGNWETAKGGTPITIKADGTFTGAGSSGRWREFNSKDAVYELTWANGSVDRVRLSEDGQHLEDSNPFSSRVIATRVGTR